MAVSGYIYDLDKAYDFMSISKEEFLNIYSCLTEEDYEAMYKDFHGENKIELLAEFMRDSENMLIEENSVMCDTECIYKGFSVTGEQLKLAVADYVYKNFSKEEQQEFEDWCEGMAC